MLQVTKAKAATQLVPCQIQLGSRKPWYHYSYMVHVRPTVLVQVHVAEIAVRSETALDWNRKMRAKHSKLRRLITTKEAV